MPVPFLGEDRHQIVKGLIDDFDAVVRDEGPRMVVLSSLPGWGKTRIVQEFYGRLATERQGDGPHYWPHQMLDESLIQPPQGATPLSAARKVVYPAPPFVVEANATMPWMWWGISCQRSTVIGQADTALDDAARQLIFHAADLTRGPALQLGGRVVDLSPDLLKILETIGVGALSIATGGVGGAVLGGAKAGYDNRDLLGKIRQVYTRRKERQDERTIEATDTAAQADETMAESLIRLSRARPMVIVIDDAHTAGSRVVRLVDRLLSRPSAQVLVVATSWPGVTTQTPTTGATTGAEAQVGEKVADATTHDPEATLTTFTPWAHRRIAARTTDDRRVDLDELGPADAHSLITSQLPAAAPVADQLIARHGTNPLHLRALLQLSRLTRAAATRPLGPKDLQDLPTDLEAIYAELWDDLPEVVRNVLGLAAQLRGERYVTEVLIKACSEEPQIVTDGLTQAINPHSWSRPIDELVHGFIEPILQKTAAHKGTDLLIPEQIDDLHTAIIDLAAQIDDLTLSPEARRIILTQHAALAQDAAIDTVPADQAAARSAYMLAEDAASGYEYAAAISLARQALEWGDAENLDVRHHLAYWLGQSGQHTEAITQFTALLADLARVLGPDHPHALTTRNNLALQLGKSGQHTEAITQFTALLKDQTRILGPDHPDTLTTRNNLAAVLGDSGQLTEAITHFTALLDDQPHILGPDHPGTLTTRNNLAALLGDSGQLTEAITHFTALLDDLTRILGPDHPHTFTTRSNLASLLGESGQHTEAITQYTALLNDRTRILGPDHPDTLGARGNLARFLGDSGQLTEAITHFTALLDDLTRILGPDHPHTLTTRSNLASLLGKSGQHTEAITQYTALLKDQTRILGPDHPETLTARHNLASLLGQSGKHTEAITHYTALLKDQTRILGPDHPQVATTRFNLARALADDGQWDRAIAHGREVLAWQTDGYGSAHAAPLQTRFLLVRWTAEAEGLEAVRGELHELRPLLERVLGPDHPMARAVVEALELLGEA